MVEPNISGPLSQYHEGCSHYAPTTNSTHVYDADNDDRSDHGANSLTERLKDESFRRTPWLKVCKAI
jgi:hypothetical protein